MEAAFKLKALDAYKSQSQDSVPIAHQVQINLLRFSFGRSKMQTRSQILLEILVN